MDMLANYDEDSENRQLSSENDSNAVVSQGQSLEDEYSMFEKMIGGADPDDAEKCPSEEKTQDHPASRGEGRCSLAESVKKIMEQNSEAGDSDALKREKSVTSDSDSSRESSKSRSPSSSPERKSRERTLSTNSTEKDSVKTADDNQEVEVKSPKRKRSRSHTPSSKKRDHHKSSRHRSRSHDRKRDKDRHSRHHKRSKSRDHKHDRDKRHRSSRDRKDRHRRHKRSKSRDRHSRRHKSRSPRRHRRSPDRHRSPDRPSRRSPTTSNKPFTFKDQMRQQLLKASKILQNNESLTGIDGKELEMPKEKPSNLPLNSKDVFSAISSAGGVTPQMALLQTMATMHQKAQEMTGIAVPKYYNPAAVNPLKYAEQVQKRKLLWSKAKDHKEDKEKEWKTSASLASDPDGKTTAKFCKLMGIKGEGSKAAEGEGEGATAADMLEAKKKQHDELFSRLDKDYEFARMTTHTQRGVGLGFSSQVPMQPR